MISILSAPPHPYITAPVRAECVGADPEIFFPEQGCSSRAAREVCGRCRLIDACGNWAANVTGLHGVWGATTVKGRRLHVKGRKSS